MVLLLFLLQNVGNRIIGNGRQHFLYQFILVRRSPGAEDFPFRFVKFLKNLPDKGVRLTLAVYHFRKAGSGLSVCIQLGKSHFLIGPVCRIFPEKRLRFFRAQGAGGYLLQYIFHIHDEILYMYINDNNGWTGGTVKTAVGYPLPL